MANLGYGSVWGNYCKVGAAFKVGILSFGISKSKQVIVTNEGSLLPSYTTTKMTVTPDKVAIKKALESGITIEGCYIQENLNLKIK